MSMSLSNYQCDPNNIPAGYNGRGVTYWGPTSIMVEAEETATITFTPTKPKCYNWKDNCNVYFNSSISTASNSDIQMKFSLNNSTITFYLPAGTTGYVGAQAIELANFGEPYNDTATNTIKIQNTSTVDVLLSPLRIFRIYQMCTLDCDKYDLCTGTTPIGEMEQYLGCFGSFNGQTIACATLTDVGSVGLDTLNPGGRVDYPCNFDICGGRSYTGGSNPTYNNTVIPAGGTVQWTFNFSNFSGYNYIDGDVCLFNFNKVYPTTTDTLNSYVKLDTSLNGATLPWGYKISSSLEHYFYPSCDLGDVWNYHDNGINTITLVNSGSVSVKMEDGYGVNLYRIYETSTDIHPFTISASAGYGGTINPSGLVEFDEHDNQSFTVTPSSGFIIYNVRVDDGTIWPCPPQCSSYVYPFYDVVGDHVIVALFDDCGACETCETGCEVSCQTGCEVSCQTGCEVSCQTTCELNCQTGCELCQVGCEVCETGCEVSCQTGCEVSCQTGCQVTCQTGCEVACQNCETCEDCQYCEVMCMTPCDLCESN